MTAQWPPEPPVPMPDGRVVLVPGRGELFVRDSGGDGPPVVLLHGWMFSADLNFWRTYGPLADAGFRVLAVDHRGHGRGIRSQAPFRLADCAADVAGLVDELDLGPVIAVGYSMGGPIAQLLALEHPDKVAGLVLCATSTQWKDVRQRLLWSSLAVVRLLLGLAPDVLWRRGLRLAGFPDSPITTWTTAELTRGSAVDLAEAGRELQGYDARPWIGDLLAPVAVVVTTEDGGVPPDHQRELARLMDAPTYDVRGDHGACITKADEFNGQLLGAIAHVRAGTTRATAAA